MQQIKKLGSNGLLEYPSRRFLEQTYLGVLEYFQIQILQENEPVQQERKKELHSMQACNEAI